MGTVSGVTAIDEDLYREVERRRHLRRLVDVVEGVKPPSLLGLPEGTRFAMCYLDKSWEDQERMLGGLTLEEPRAQRPDGLYRNARRIEVPFKDVLGWRGHAVMFWLDSIRSMITRAAKRAGHPIELASRRY